MRTLLSRSSFIAFMIFSISCGKSREAGQEKEAPSISATSEGKTAITSSDKPFEAEGDITLNFDIAGKWLSGCWIPQPGLYVRSTISFDVRTLSYIYSDQSYKDEQCETISDSQPTALTAHYALNSPVENLPNAYYFHSYNRSVEALPILTQIELNDGKLYLGRKRAKTVDKVVTWTPEPGFFDANVAFERVTL